MRGPPASLSRPGRCRDRSWTSAKDAAPSLEAASGCPGQLRHARQARAHSFWSPLTATAGLAIRSHARPVARGMASWPVREMTRTARTDDQGQRDPARSGKTYWLQPELATLTADRFSDPAWIFERKFDGERCLAFRAGPQLRLMTRNRQQVTSTYPEIADALWAQQASDFIVDGEVVAFDGDRTSFSRLQRRLGVR